MRKSTVRLRTRLHGRTDRASDPITSTSPTSHALEERASAFEERVLTPAAWETASSRRDRVIALGARCAAKEAVTKTLCTDGGGRSRAPAGNEVPGIDRTPPELVLHAEAAKRAEEQAHPRGDTLTTSDAASWFRSRSKPRIDSFTPSRTERERAPRSEDRGARGAFRVGRAGL